ncbi:hypothetical protein T484DRAFT_1779474 [Baffinella frigidus]|nr:hypothetical protein T484DRAFT_1779474 [Cryptophyta sp. CCMP2293]
MQTLVDNLYKDIEERKRGAERADTEKAELRNEVQYLREQLWVIQPLQTSLQGQVEDLNREIDSAKNVRRGALEAMEDSHGAAAQEREMRKRLDRIVLELRQERDDMKTQKEDLEMQLKEELLNKDGLQRDLEHERQWREEWNAVHDQVRAALSRLHELDAPGVRAALSRLHELDAPGVIEERSHQVMAILQERIASEAFSRSKVTELEDKLHREQAQRMMYERRLAAMQSEMLEVRVRAARGALPLEPDSLSSQFDPEHRESASGGAGAYPSRIPKPMNMAALKAGGNVVGGGFGKR